LSSVDSKLYQYAVQEAQAAVELDEKGHYRQALNKYQRAAEILIQFVKYNKNPIMVRKCHDQIEQYLDRANVIKAHISGPKARRGIPSRPSRKPSESKDGEPSTDEGQYSPEEQEIIDSISGTILTESPDVKWTDIAGLEGSKQALREAIVLPIMKPNLFTGARKPWSGILLFGPPGCGKTLLARAAATECKATFFSVSSADLLSKWLGESEKLISSLFKVARIKAPSLIFMDEIDSVATRRGEGHEGGGERRVKTQLLSEIQGVKSRGDKPLLVLGATNRPWDIDTAIFKIHTAGINMALTEEDFIELGVRSEGYSGRDISNVCREVIMIPIRELDMGGLLEDSDQEVIVRDIALQDFMKTLKKVKPMTKDKSLDQYDQWAKEFGEY
jgi:vacuolar protein-sorting-associated protein 4